MHYTEQTLYDAALHRAGVVEEAYCQTPPAYDRVWQHGWLVTHILVPGNASPDMGELYKVVIKPKSRPNRALWQEGQRRYFSRFGFNEEEANWLARCNINCKHELAPHVKRMQAHPGKRPNISTRKLALAKQILAELTAAMAVV
jgi:hypothetical protein